MNKKVLKGLCWLGTGSLAVLGLTFCVNRFNVLIGICNEVYKS